MEKNTVITVAVSAVAGGVVGGVITYLAVNKTLRDRYELRAAEEIESVKHRYSLLRKEDGDLTILAQAQNPSPEVQAAVNKGKELMEQLGYLDGKHVAHDEPDPSAQTLSIFDHSEVMDAKDYPDDYEGVDDEEDESDYKVIDGEPFLITEADYFENVPEYQLDTLTYYELDDTLTDEKNSQIDRVEETVGARHLHMFKKVNGQPKTSLYIQNDTHETLYEVILVEQSYAAVILGMDEVELGLKQPKQRPKKMKANDD